MDWWRPPVGSLRRMAAVVAATIPMLVSGCAETSPLFQGGPGSHESDPFNLDGGSYLLGWTVSAQTTAGCQIEVEILQAGGEAAVGRISAEATSGGASQDAELIPDLAAGDYRLRVESTCESWTAVVGEASRTRP
jgi:hypothetical protein